MKTRDLPVSSRIGIRLLIVALGVPACASADPLAIPRWTVDGGGTGFVEVGTFRLGGTAGQPDAGRLVGSPYVLVGGFWSSSTRVVIGVDDGPAPHPGVSPPVIARVHAAAPNPFVDRTAIAFDLPEAREVDIRVFDVGGGLLRVLGSGVMPAGRHALAWDAADAEGRRARAGLYFVRVRLGEFRRTQKVILLP